MAPMSEPLVALAAACALVAAARSTWSPCGLSMLSTITPMGERARRYTYGGTAAWFVVGAVLGGVTLGAATAVLAAGVSALDLDPDVALAAAAVLALVGAASDARLGGFRAARSHAPGQRGLARPLPQLGLRRRLRLADRRRPRHLHRDGGGLPHHRPGGPDRGTGDGVRHPHRLRPGAGLAVLVSRSATTVERLQALHRRFDAWSAPSRVATIVAQVVLAAAAATAAYGVGAAMAVATVAVVVALVVLSQRRAVAAAPRTTAG